MEKIERFIHNLTTNETREALALIMNECLNEDVLQAIKEWAEAQGEGMKDEVAALFD